MKQTLLLVFLLFSCGFGFSQTEKPIHGKVQSGTIFLKNVDIVNLNSKKNVVTDSEGNFNILVKAGDELFIISKEYTDQKIKLSQTDFDNNNLVILLEKKPIELDNINIVKVQNMKIKLSQGEIDELRINKQSTAPKVLGVYDGTIENGVDFIKLGKKLIHLLKKKDREPADNKAPAPSIKSYLEANFDTAFYLRKLNLNPEEINLFISFCEADPKAQTIAEHQDILEAMDFLMVKNDEFKKLTR
ncbi:hypothetical protein EZL74_02955 [Flavobacterium silvisoli]|uniref:Carboxypeptidase-like regulatory domain-containing protein n=1 Tax=Flavobacterium silvisoli TaxID=2529433 RepID=A0A4Q9Z3C9_9FLAO|nr:hypothetical protein [Flavobacterium silvisoli]TBX70648.1 hypothetical protein EZL74_02955 [Flavobacterium silvisoli]